MPKVWPRRTEFPTFPHPSKDGDGFYSLITKAQIIQFNENLLPSPLPRTCYDGDLNLEAYSSSSRPYAGKQRKEALDEHWEAFSTLDHINEALEAPFSPSLQTHLPSATKKTLSF